MPAPPALPALPASSPIRDLLDQARAPGVLSLAGGLPATELLPVADVAAATAAVFAADGGAALQYGPTRGEPRLLERLAALEGVATDGLVVTTGSQQGLDLLARVLVRPGDTVVVEDPCYLGARSVLERAGARLVGIPVDRHGLDVDALAARLAADRRFRPVLVYVDPAFQNPTGATLTPGRAAALVALAERYGFVVVDDDPYGALALEDPAPPTPAPLRQGSGHVVRLRTVSKLAAPGARLGWVVAHPALAEHLVVAKQSVDLHTQTLGQLVLAELLGRAGWLDGVAAAARPVYRARRDALVDALDHHLGGRAAYRRPAGGLFVWVEPIGTGPGTGLLPLALAEGVAVVPGEVFRLTPGPPALRLSFSSLPPQDLDEAVLRLARAVVRGRR